MIFSVGKMEFARKELRGNRRRNGDEFKLPSDWWNELPADSWMWVSSWDQLYSKKTIDKKMSSIKNEKDALERKIGDVRETVARTPGCPQQTFIV
jgi:hypothetical protein